MQSKTCGPPPVNPVDIGRVRLRKARRGDVDAVHIIEQEQFPHPWKKEQFCNELSHDIAWFYVAEAEHTGEIAGYIIFWIFGETSELHDIAVSSRYKKKGLGSRLLNFLLDTVRAEHVEEVFLEVRRSNREAIAFYEKYNFKQIGTRKNYYSSPVEDALIYGLYL